MKVCCHFQITAASALLLRALDLAAIGTDFEIGRGFNVPWRSHQWQGRNFTHQQFITSLHAQFQLVQFFIDVCFDTRHRVLPVGMGLYC
jgi:hypothetical protein